MASNAPCPNCGRLNRPSAKRCASCGNVLPQQAATPIPPPPPPPPAQQPSRQQPLPPPPPPFPPRQQPTPPPQSPRQQPVPPPPPLRQQPLPPPPPPQKPGGKSSLPSNLPLKPWQIAALIGVVVILCLCLMIANAVSGILKPKATPTELFPPITSLATLTLTAQSPTSAPIVAITPTTPTPIVITATPMPATHTPTATRVPPTAAPSPTSEPSQTPTPKPTATPTSTASPTATATLAPDTAPGTVLDVGQTWHQQNLALTLNNARFAGVACNSVLEFDLAIENDETTIPELVIGWRGEDMTLADDQNKPYDMAFQPAPRSPDCTKYQPIKSFTQSALASKASVKIAIQVTGTLPDTVKEFTLSVAKAGRIQNAKWKIKIPR